MRVVEQKYHPLWTAQVVCQHCGSTLEICRKDIHWSPCSLSYYYRENETVEERAERLNKEYYFSCPLCLQLTYCTDVYKQIPIYAGDENSAYNKACNLPVSKKKSRWRF